MPPRPTTPVSVVILTKDEAANIVECLDAVCAQLADGDEVLVVDAASRDDTVALVQRVAERRPGIVRLHASTEHLTFGAARKALQEDIGSTAEFIEARGGSVYFPYTAPAALTFPIPDGIDFLSPGLIEAECMRRVATSTRRRARAADCRSRADADCAWPNAWASARAELHVGASTLANGWPACTASNGVLTYRRSTIESTHPPGRISRASDVGTT